MSANRQRIASAIRSLALTPEERRSLLGDGQNKGGKPGSTGVGTSEAEESRLCCDGSVSGSTNPGTSDRDAGSGGQDGLDSSDPANLSDMGDGSLIGLTDCATGAPVCFEGDGFIPPDGWDDPQDPPVDPGYTEGIYYRFGYSGTDSTYQTIERAISGEGVQSPYCYTDTGNIGTNQIFVYQNIDENLPCGESGGTTGGMDRVSCASSYDPICDEPPPIADEWPSDSCVNLAIQSGTIVGSKYDPENDGTYSAPRDSIDLCDGNGNQISLAPSASGGWKTIDAINGGDGYLYDSSGTQIARISEAEYSDPNV